MSIHIRRLVPMVLAAAFVAVVAIAIAGGRDKADFRVHFTVPEATNILVGTPVRASGQDVGSIRAMEPIDGGRAARLEVQITDEKALPLPQGTRLQLRWGTTISYGARFVDLKLGPVGAPAIPDGATIPTRDVSTPVEFDDFTRTFDARTRRDLKALLERAGDNVRAAGPQLRTMLPKAVPAVQQGDAVVSDLNDEGDALTTLVRSADQIVDAIDVANPTVGDLVNNTSRVFRTTAAEARDLRRTLAQTPTTLVRARRTLDVADATLAAAGALARDIRPGVTELKHAVPTVNHTLTTLSHVAPNLRATLRTVHQAAPDVNDLLRRATTLTPQLASIGHQAAPEVGCIRPYAPEIAGFATGWADFTNGADADGRYARANVTSIIPAPYTAAPQTSDELTKAFPSLLYSFPRPPGMNAGQPWLQPQCQAGPDALDASKDPEARRPGEPRPKFMEPFARRHP